MTNKMQQFWLIYLFIPNQLYIFRVMSSNIIRSTWLYLQIMIMSTGIAAGITAFTRVRHLSLSWAGSIQSIPPHPSSWIYVLILSSRLRLCIPCGPYTYSFPTKTLYTRPPSPIRVTPPKILLLDFTTRKIFGVRYRSLSSTVCSSLHSQITSSLLCSNIPLNILLSKTLTLLFSLNVSYQFSHHTKQEEKLFFCIN